MEVHRRGGRVLLGAATDGAQMAYQPFVDALSDVIADSPEAQLHADAQRHFGTLSRLFPTVAARFGRASAAGIDPLTERDELQAAIAELVAQSARRHPTMLVLEDMHWASALTREAALHIVRNGGTAPLLVVLTTRDTAPELDSALTSWLAAAERLGDAMVARRPRPDRDDRAPGHARWQCGSRRGSAWHGRQPPVPPRGRHEWRREPNPAGLPRQPMQPAERRRPRRAGHGGGARRVGSSRTCCRGHRAAG